ncbi:unnamed protein product [Peniophora sp. CBMAI 1063]|nr:unnamed protein product [Peniophora sp. CBMAI 1063]
MSDLNERIAHSQPWPQAHARQSVDAKTGGNGTALGFMPAAFTPFNSRTSADRDAAVVDYAIASPTAIPFVLDLHILNRKGASDHAPTALRPTLPCHCLAPILAPSKLVLAPKASLSVHTELDRRIVYIIKAARAANDESRLLDLYRTMSGLFKKTIVYTDGSSHGNGSDTIAAGDIEAWVPGSQTNNRAEAYRILLALTSANLNRDLRIKPDLQWHGNILWKISRLLKAGIAFTHFHHVCGQSGEEGNDGVDSCANEGSRQPAVEPFVAAALPTLSHLLTAQNVRLKIATSLANPDDDPEMQLLGRQAQWFNGDKAHREHEKAARAQRQKRNFLLNSRHYGSPWWSAWKDLMDKKRVAFNVPASRLQPVFEERMNPPASIPPSFYAAAAT